MVPEVAPCRAGQEPEDHVGRRLLETHGSRVDVPRDRRTPEVDEGHSERASARQTAGPELDGRRASTIDLGADGDGGHPVAREHHRWQRPEVSGDRGRGHPAEVGEIERRGPLPADQDRERRGDRPDRRSLRHTHLNHLVRASSDRHVGLKRQVRRRRAPRPERRRVRRPVFEPADGAGFSPAHENQKRRTHTPHHARVHQSPPEPFPASRTPMQWEASASRDRGSRAGASRPGHFVVTAALSD